MTAELEGIGLLCTNWREARPRLLRVGKEAADPLRSQGVLLRLRVSPLVLTKLVLQIPCLP